MLGKIYLVGAGPGDPGLMTLKGKRCLEHADVIVYDYLANPRLLDHAPAAARRILVAKHGGGSRVEQSGINALIVDCARQGLNVVRLKGGDPVIFGRGAEEAEAAVAAGIDFEIVPGVTAAVAVPAYAGIPLPHLASNVIFTTGYEYHDKPELAVHWEELARSGSTLVILMTQRQLRANMEKLRNAGLAASTPAAVIEWGTRAAQRTIVGTVATLADRADEQHVRPPALAIVGEVVRLRERLNWFERKPLFGRRIVITRPRHQAADFADLLEAWGAEVVPFPTIEIAAPDSYDAVDDALRRADQFDWVVLTSANGVRAFFDRIAAIGGDIRDWHRAKFAAIGPQTAKTLTEHGVRVASIPAEYRAEAVVDALAATGIAGKRILLPRAAGARALLPEQLRSLGAVVEEVITYQSIAPAQHVEELRQLLTQGAVDVITFTSSSTVHNFVAAVGTDAAALLTHVQVGCIGPITADTARSYGMTVAIQPDAYTVPAFVDAIVQQLQRR